jgi:hypothetical protein
VGELRKLFLASAWRYLKNADVHTRQWAYVVVARFLQPAEGATATPEKIAYQVWVSLLRASSTEARPLVRQAIDILLPILKTYSPIVNDQGSVAVWAKWVGKILRDESHNTPLLVHLMQMIARHSVTFYDARHNLVSSVVGALIRIGLVQEKALENKELAMRLVTVILEWQKRWASSGGAAAGAIGGGTGTADDASGDGMPARQVTEVPTLSSSAPSSHLHLPQELGGGAAAAAANTEEQHVEGVGPQSAVSTKLRIKHSEFVSRQMQEQIYTFLVRIASSTDVPGTQPSSSSQAGSAAPAPDSIALGQPPQSEAQKHTYQATGPAQLQRPAGIRDITSWAVELVDTALQLWPKFPIKVHYLDRLVEGSKDSPHYGVVALRLLTVVVARQGKEFLDLNAKSVQTMLVTMMNLSNPNVQPTLSSLIQSLVGLMPFSAYQVFWETLASTVFSVLRPATALGAGTVGAPSTSWATVLEALASVHPDLVWQEKDVPIFMAYAKQMARLYLSTSKANSPLTAAPTSSHGAAPSQPPSTATTGNSTGVSAMAGVDSAVDGAIPSSIVSASSALSVLFKLLCESTLTPVTRTSLLELAAELWGKCRDLDMLSLLLRVCEVHVFKDSCPTTEQCQLIEAILARLRGEGPALPEAAMSRLYAHLYRILESSVFAAKPALPVQETVVLLGLELRDVEVRSRIFARWAQSIGSNDVMQRLLFVVGTQKWESMAERLWYRQVLYLFFDVLDKQDEGLCWAPLTSRIEAPLRRQRVAAPRSAKLARTDAGGELTALVEEHQIFLDACAANSSLRRVVQSLSVLIGDLPALLQSLFEWLVPEVWAQASDGQRLALSLQCNRLFEATYHQKQPLHHNVIQAFLQSFARCEPVPVLDTKLFATLAPRFGCWTPCETLLQRLIGPPHSAAHDDTVSRLSQLHAASHQPALACAVWRLLPSASPLTHAAVSRMLQGQWDRAQELLFEAMDSSSDSSSAESRMWDDMWVECAKQLGQWNLLVDYGHHKGDLELLLQCAWKTGDWRSMRDAIRVAPRTDESQATQKLYAGLCTIIDAFGTGAGVGLSEGSSMAKVELCKSLLAESVQAGLKQWTLLLSMRVSDRHLGMIRFFRRVVDALESVQIAREVASTRRHPNSLPDIKNKLSAWRDRTPSNWEAPSDWSDVLLWRHWIYGVLVRHLAGDADQSVSSLGMHELAWSLCAFSRVARKQNLLQASLETLNRVYQLPTLQLDDAFFKLREQVLCYAKVPAAVPDALSILANTSTEYFTEHQQSAWSVLRGKLVELQARQSSGGAAQHFQDQANLAYADATRQGQSSFAKGWVKWGLFCERMMRGGAVDQKKWAAYLLTCFAQAIKLNAQSGKIHVPKLVWLLTFDAETGQAHANLFAELPPWVLLDSLQPLIMAWLANGGLAPLSEQLLAHVGQAHPQPVYYALRACSGMLHEFKRPIPALERVAAALVQQHPELLAIEEFCVALEKIFCQPPDEDLITEALLVLVRECMGLPAGSAIPGPMKDKLSELGAQFGARFAELSKLATGKGTKVSALLVKLHAALQGEG